MDSIAKKVQEAEQNYISGTTQTGKYVDFSLYETVEKIYAYLNSRHISGDVDSMGREKPFFNIVTSATNIWYRATDIDRKNIRIKATKSSNYLPAFLANVKLKDWMRKAQFGVFLNQWGRTLAEYGSAVVKFVERDGELHSDVIPWNRLIIDNVDINNNLIIEKIYYTPATLRAKKGYDQEKVKELLDELVARKNLDGTNKDTESDFIEVYEVHGNLPLSYLTGRETDEDTFVQQMHVISYFVNRDDKNEVDEYCLVKGKETKSPYMITHLIKEDGRAIGKGAVEHLFEGQWMVNHSMKSIKDQLDLASKLIFQTADGTFVGRNALTNLENGDILVHSPNAPLTQVANSSHDVSSLQNVMNQWQVLSQQITSTPDAISGNNFPSGTAYRQVALLNQEAHSLFEIMTENKGLDIENMCREFIIPFIKKQLDTTEEIVATLDSHELSKLDAMYLGNKATKIVNESIKKRVLEGEIVSENVPTLIEETKKSLQEQMSVLGNERFFSPEDVPGQTWKELFKDLEWEVEVEVTNETTDKEQVLTTLTTVLQSVVSNPQMLENPTAKSLFNKILEQTGVVSPIEVNQMTTTMPQQQETLPLQSMVKS